MKITEHLARAAAPLAGLIIAALCAVPAHSAILMKIDGVDGGAGEKYRGHENWIELDSASWGVSNSGTFQVGGGGGAGKANFQDFAWTQQLDQSFPLLFKASATGEFYPKVTIDWLRPGAGDAGAASAEPYFQMELRKVLVSNLTLSSHSSVGDLVSGSLNYAEIEMSYWTYDVDGTRNARPVKAGYNVATNEGSLVALTSVYAIGSTGLALTSVPVPAAGWLLGSAVLGLIGIARRRRVAR